MKKLAFLMILLLLLAAGCNKKPVVTPTPEPAPTASPSPTPAPTDAPEETATPGSLQPADKTPEPEKATPGSLGGKTTHATPGNLEPTEPQLEDSYWDAVSYETEYYGTVGFDSNWSTVNLRLLKGGKGIFRSSFWTPYAEESGPVTWTEDDGKLTVTCRDGTVLTGGIAEGKLVLNYRDGTLLMAPQAVPPRGEDLGTELLQGCWALQSIKSEGSAAATAEEGIRAYLRIHGDSADLYWHTGNEKQSWFEEDMGLSILWEPLYEGSPNGYWQAELSGESPVYRGYALTAEGQDRLLLRITAFDSEESEYGEVRSSVTTCVFAPVSPDKVEVMTAPAPVTVSTVEEMMDAIRDRATVLLAPGTYNVTEWITSAGEEDLGIWARSTQPHNAQGLYDSGFDDQPELTVAGMRQLTIASADPKHPALIVCEPRYSNVIAFFNCKELTLRDLIVGHTPEPGFCTGAVLKLSNCSASRLEGCELYGCGTYGVTAENSWDLRLSRCEIRDCTYGCLDFRYVSDAFVSDTKFHDCEGYTNFCFSGSIVEFTGCDFRNLKDTFLYLDDYSWASFEGCSFDQATHEALLNSPYGEDQLSYDADANSAPKG